MSENLDLVRSILSRWERGDFSSTDYMHPDIEYGIVGGPAPGRWKGVAGVVEGWRGILDAWKELRFEAEQFQVLDDERVLVLYRWSGHGRASGLDLSGLRSEGAALFQIQDGKVIRLFGYLERDRALADLGLNE
jgi:ketosteroid isomerase-like protein